MRITFRAIRADNVLWNKDKYNANQSSRDKIYLTLIYNREKEIKEESWESRENEKQREWEKVRNLFLV